MMDFNCASTTAGRGKELRREQEPAVADTSEPGQCPSALCCSRGDLVTLSAWTATGDPCLVLPARITPSRWHLVSVLSGTRLLFARTSLHRWELHGAAFLLQQLEGLCWLFFSWLCLLLWLLTSSVSWFDMSDWKPSEINGSLLEASCYFLW